MLNVTESAASHLHEALDDASENESHVLRLTHTNEGLSLQLGFGQESDQLVEHADKAILAIEAAVSESLDGKLLDAQETPEGTRLVLRELDE